MNRHARTMEAREWQEEAFDLGRWCVVPREKRVTDGETEAFIEPKVMQVLICLARQPGEVVPRDEIMEAVWHDVVVGDEVLTRAVSELRRVFGDDARNPSVIATVPKVGYQLLAPVRRHAAASRHTSSSRPVEITDDRAAPAATRRMRTWAWLALAAVCLVGGITWGARRSPQPPPLLPAVPATSMPGVERDPALSPDGSRLAFAHQGRGENTWHLFITDVASGRVIAQTSGTGSDRYPAWSPDGRHVAFIRLTDGECALYTTTAAGGSPQRLAPCARGSTAAFLSWAPDGRALFLSERDGARGRYRMVRLSIDTRTAQLMTDAGTFDDVRPVPSPDGHVVAFVRHPGPETADIYVVPAAGGSPKRLTFGLAVVNGLGWMPDGRTLVYSSFEGHRYSLWQVATTGGTPTVLTSGQGSISSPTFASASGRMVYVRWQYETDVWRIPAGRTGASPAGVVTSTQADRLPQISPDGRRLAFVSERSGQPELWISATDGSGARRLTDGGRYIGYPPRWSPDGRRIAYSRVDEQRKSMDLYVVDAEGGLPRRLTTDPASDVAPFWSPDGTVLLFGSDRSGSWQLWALPVDGDERTAVQRTDTGGVVGQVSPDGASLYFLRPEAPGLWRMPPGGGHADRLDVPLDPVKDVDNWAVTADGIFFVYRTQGATQIRMFDLDTGQTTVRLDAAAIPRNGGLTVSPDGAWIYYTRLDHVESDIERVDDVGKR